MTRSLHFADRFFMAQGFSITVSPRFCIFAAISLILIPLPWLVGWFVAAAVHELFHCLALCMCRKKISQILIDIDGAQICTAQLTDGQIIFCALAGPAGGGLLLFLSGHCPRLALCAFIQTLFNILPIYPLDGGRALRGLTRVLCSDTVSQRIYCVVEAILIMAILLLCVCAAFILHLGLSPILLAAFFFLRMKKIKIPCK